ncbi:hypothetical protein C2G38_1422481 [Gigaspora rosea]|uniref:Uncharacterized protein n=1 Tax=Gigaspora rosea TaxID=44941 RepID=A0A397W7M6_9GLOM|nr:hypothetical protein C2G38_1422481 [Gigaspora rosea]
MSAYTNNNEDDEPDFVSNVYNYDWSSTSLGPMELWDNSITNAVVILFLLKNIINLIIIIRNNNNDESHTNFRNYAFNLHFPPLFLLLPYYIISVAASIKVETSTWLVK